MAVIDNDAEDFNLDRAEWDFNEPLRPGNHMKENTRNHTKSSSFAKYYMRMT